MLHDELYAHAKDMQGNPLTKAQCDWQFLRAMYSQANEYSRWRRLHYYTIIARYYLAVAVFGKPAWDRCRANDP